MTSNDRVTCNADLSNCGLYRWSLHRAWDISKPMLGWIMLNPSTADAMKDDPTIRRCMSFARTWEFGGIDVCNLFGLRATDPAELARSSNPVGAMNDGYLLQLIQSCPQIVCAWGAHNMAKSRARTVMQMLRGRSANLVCLGVTREKFPRHPLYVKATTSAIPYSGD